MTTSSHVAKADAAIRQGAGRRRVLAGLVTFAVVLAAALSLGSPVGVAVAAALLINTVASLLR
jgi:hypothetical protein